MGTNKALPDGFYLTCFAEKYVTEAAIIEKRVFSEPWSEAAIRLVFVESQSIFALAVVSGDGMLAAYGGVECVMGEANIVNIATSPEFRRCGCGYAVMDGLLRVAADQKCSYITLEVREHNSAAIALYSLFGFEAVGKRKHFYRFPAEDAIVMAKNI